MALYGGNVPNRFSNDDHVRPATTVSEFKRYTEWLDERRFNDFDRQWLKDFHISL